jgi:general secretion pathway protein A
MYKSFYQLHSKPFSLLPDSEFLYLGSTHRTAYSLLEYGLLTEAPFMVLTGDPGTGKTSLLHRLIADTRDAYSIGFLSNARYDVEYLLPWILLALGLNNKQLDPVEAQHLFAKFLAQDKRSRQRRVVLIMDEAQNLGVKLLEELRLLSNLNQEKTLQLQIILSGQPDLTNTPAPGRYDPVRAAGRGGLPSATLHGGRGRAIHSPPHPARRIIADRCSAPRLVP